ncbi:hypothetical protein [Fibrobacter sp. UWP2]|uniref:hypothetical protein n=1 Tax=Fibrobacter sp. UWP2 TaxID=1896216 RepID=UPI00091AE830|nr:hypothetical protein [Fibrobacter sp. UWP2]SHJ44399.1 hypothetical protein SAMN05720471_14014 [Fibrobacter sp. UWP2]
MAEHELNKIVDDDGEVFNLRDSTKQPTADRVSSWGSTPSDTKYPSEKLVKDSLDAKANDSDVVHKTGTETVSGAKTFNNTSSVFSGKCANDINGVSLSSAYGVFRTELGDPTLEERAIIEETFANQLEFLPKNKIVYETSPKGTETWTTLAVPDSTHNLLWGGNVTGPISISKNLDFRITINAPYYCLLNFLYFYGGGNGATFHIKLEKKLNSSGAWSVVSDTAETSIGWPGHNTIRHSNLSFCPNTPHRYGSVRLTLYVVSTGDVESYPSYNVNKFRYYGGYPYKSDPWIVKNGSSGVTNFPKGITSGVAIPVSSGGTGATTAIGAEYNILNQVADIDTTINGDRKIALCNQTKSASNGVFRWIKLRNVWTWIKGLLSSESGVNISGSSASCTGNAATATALSAGADRTKLDGIAAGAEVNVQSDWNQTTTTADDYIKNKPTLGTAAAKDVPTSGNASNTQVVMGNDSRLTNSRTPTNHASSETTYGIGTTSNYGHVKLATGDMNGATHADGVAVSKNHTHSQYLTSHQDISGKLNKDASNAITGSGTGTAPTLLEGLGIGTRKISSGDVFIPTTNAEGAADGKWFKRKLANIAYGITGYGLGSIQVTNEDYSAQVGMSYGDFYNSSTPIYGWKIGTTSVNVPGGWATCNLRAIVVITDWSGTGDYSPTDFIGTLTINDRMSAASLSTDSWKFIGRLTSLQPQRTDSGNRGWALYCKGNSSTYSHEWYIGRRGSTASQMNGEIKYSKITILPLFESRWTRAMERVNSPMTFNTSNYDDWWAQYVNVALPAETYSVGSASLPVYIDPNKEIKPIERSIILYDNRPNQTYKDPFFSARIDDDTFCNIEAWNKNGTIMCGLYARNGSGTTAGFISYMDSTGYLHFGEDQDNSWSGRSGNGSSGSQKHYFNGAEICGSSLRNSGTSHYRLYFGKMTPGTDNGAKHFCGLLEVNTIANTSGAVRGTGFVAIIKIDSRNYDEFHVNVSIISNNSWNLTGLRPTLIVKEDGNERLFAIGFTNASGTLQAFQYTRFNLTQIGYSLGFTYDRWFSTASSQGSGEYFWPATLGDAENAVSANELRVPYGSGSIYLQIGVSGSYLALGTNMADGVMVSYAGEASTAAVASRLGTASVGSADNPIYLNNGVPTACNWWVS